MNLDVSNNSINKLYKIFDTNNDGKLSIEEVLEGLDFICYNVESYDSEMIDFLKNILNINEENTENTELITND
jgi:Ca2+-binding EF-hand superfamily protein